jgi:HEAT repeat protein
MLWLTLQQLKSADAARRCHAIQRLADSHSPRALDGLARVASDRDPQVRAAAITVIGGIENERSKTILLQALRDSHPDVRRAALDQLKRHLGVGIQPALATALRDADGGVRGRAARLLEQSGWRPVDQLDQIWYAIARGQLKQAAAHGAIAIRALESILSGGGYNLQVAAVEALGSISDERVFKSLVRALRSTDHTVCIAAIAALSNTGGPRTVDELTPMLKHKDHRVRVAAIESLAMLDAPRIAQSLCNLLKDAMWDVRCAAAEGLAKAKDPQAVDGLVAILEDKYADVRSAAAASLGRLGDARAIGPLVLALKDTETSVRKAAATALDQIDPKWAQSEAASRMASELRAAFNSPDWFVRYAASTALELIGHGQHQPLDQAETEIATPAKQRQQRVFNTFLELLLDADGDLRLAAAEALGRLGDFRAKSTLMTALSDPYDAVRGAATQALTLLGIQ